MIRHTFQQCWGVAQARVACRKCGAITTRTVREYCTVNPFNKDERGNVLGPKEVARQAYVLAEKNARRQEEQGRICRKCEAIETAALQPTEGE